MCWNFHSIPILLGNFHSIPILLGNFHSIPILLGNFHSQSIRELPFHYSGSIMYTTLVAVIRCDVPLDDCRTVAEAYDSCSQSPDARTLDELFVYLSYWLDSFDSVVQGQIALVQLPGSNTLYFVGGLCPKSAFEWFIASEYARGLRLNTFDFCRSDLQFGIAAPYSDFVVPAYFPNPLPF